MFTLYYQPFACSFAVHAALEKIGEPFTLHKVNLHKGDQQSADFLALNPQGQVPVLQHAERTLTQAGAILLHLSEQFPAAQLLPEISSPARQQAMQSLFFLSNSVHPVFSRAFHPERISTTSPKEVKLLALEKVKGFLGEFDQLFSTQDYCAGQTACAPDYFLFAMLNWLPLFAVGKKEFTHLMGFIDRMKIQPEVQRSLRTEMKNM